MLPEHCVQVRTLAKIEDCCKRRVVDLEDVKEPNNVGMGQGLQ